MNKTELIEMLMKDAGSPVKIQSDKDKNRAVLWLIEEGAISRSYGASLLEIDEDDIDDLFHSCFDEI